MCCYVRILYIVVLSRLEGGLHGLEILRDLSHDLVELLEDSLEDLLGLLLLGLICFNAVVDTLPDLL